MCRGTIYGYVHLIWLHADGELMSTMHLVTPKTVHNNNSNNENKKQTN